MNVITRGVRNSFRNPIRTVAIVLILALSIGMALTMLIARQAVTNKIDSIKSSVGNTVSVSPAGVRGFEGGGEALSNEDVDELKKLEHVSTINKTLNDRLTNENSSLTPAIEAGSLGKRFAGNSGAVIVDKQQLNGSLQNFKPPINVIGTTNPTSLSATAGGGTFTLKSGEVFNANGNTNVALVGSTLAEKNNLSVGSTFTAYNQIITVVGIFDAGNTFSNNQVLMPLASLQALSEQTGAITSITLTADSIEHVASVTEAAKSALNESADVTNSLEQTENTIEPLENIQTISLYSLIGSVAAGAIIILLTMIMIVRERRREIGTLKAIGASNIRVIGQFMSEAVSFTLFGSVIGIALGVLIANPITEMLVKNSASTDTSGPMRTMGGEGAKMMLGNFNQSISNVTTTIGWEVIVYGLGVAILIAIIGSTLAAFFIAKIRPAEVMRAE